MSILNKASIATAVSLALQNAFRPVYVPALNGEVNVKLHTVAEREAFEEQAFGKDKGKQPFGATVFAHAVVNEKGERLYSDDDIVEIAKYPSSIVLPVVQAYNRYNGITPEKVEEAEKN